MESMHTVSSYLIQKLHEYGIRHIFGVPGDYILGFYDELIRSRMLNVVNTCDEQGAAFAADAYARVKGFGAVCITYCVGGLKVVRRKITCCSYQWCPWYKRTYKESAASSHGA